MVCGFQIPFFVGVYGVFSLFVLSVIVYLVNNINQFIFAIK